MLEIQLTRHAEVRMCQRGFRKADLGLALSVATRVEDNAFYVSAQDAAREIQRRKHEIQQLERLRGSKFIVEGDALITLYHASSTPRRIGHRKNRGRP